MAAPLAGKTIAVVGAGPAGATAAFLLARSRQARVLLFEERPLLGAPVAGSRMRLCGGCGGLVQAGVISQLKSLGLLLAPQVVQEDLAGYAVHHPNRNTVFDIPAPGMVSVYRGWGPLRSETPSESFDSSLARQASVAGAEYHEEHITRIQLGDGRSTPATIFSNERAYSADFVVGAFGHNRALSGCILDSGLRPAPLGTARVTRGAVREYEFGCSFVEQRYGRRVHIISDPTPNIWFAALIPKAGVVSMVLMGRDDIKVSDFDDLFSVPSMRDLVPSTSSKQCLTCACTRSSLTISSPRRFVVPGMGGIALIGDAGPTRPRKNGLAAAIDLAQNLVWCMERAGFSNKSLRRFQYHAWINYVLDDLWAEPMLGLAGTTLGIPILGSLVTRALARDKNVPIISAAMREYARLMLTGEGPYWQIPVAVLHKLFGG
jgi:flavin-dependent dehydrogenase